MKAKEYAKQFAKQFLDESPSEAIVEMGTQFYTEIFTLIESRKAKSDSAVFAVLNELNQKWKAVARIVNKVKILMLPEGFEYIIEEFMPEVWSKWEKSNNKNIKKFTDHREVLKNINSTIIKQNGNYRKWSCKKESK